LRQAVFLKARLYTALFTIFLSGLYLIHDGRPHLPSFTDLSFAQGAVLLAAPSENALYYRLTVAFVLLTTVSIFVIHFLPPGRQSPEEPFLVDGHR